MGLTDQSVLSILLRLGLAMACGGLIGWERHAAGKPGGLRTHMLVSVGAAIFVMNTSGGSLDSTSRVVQGIAAGIGFLGAGEILHVGQTAADAKVKGLTSAASIWGTAALGISAGEGLWVLAIAGCAVTMLILTVAKRIEARLPKGNHGHGGGLTD